VQIALAFAIVLLPAHERLHILRTDDLDLMAERFELPRPAKRASASFDHDHASVNLCKDFEKLVTHDPALQNHIAALIDAVQLKYVIGDIDTERLDGHCSSPSFGRLSA
jgi:hypothetical protein